MKCPAWVVSAAALAVLSGCVSQAKYRELLSRNEIQAATIRDLERDLDHARSLVETAQAKLRTARETRTACERVISSKDEQVALLKRRCADLESRIEELARQLEPPPVGEVELPPKVRDALQELAAKEPSLEFDPKTGTCKFSSDILFDTGKDTLKPEAVKLINKFAAIFTGVGKGLYLRIVGHTDDRPIVKPATRKKHPTNWHLSVHRAIAVLRALADAGVEPARMSAAGFGKWRPVVANTSPANRARNRRVEIYILNPPRAPVVRTNTGAEPTVLGGE